MSELTHNGRATLVLFSGGLDSTAMLYKYLTETRRTIHVHHVAMNGEFSDRAIVELEHVTRIINWLREHTRPFTFSYSSIETPGYAGSTSHIMYAMMAATICISEGFSAVASGRIATDNTVNGTRSFQAAEQVFTAAVQNQLQHTPLWETPMDQYCKRDLIKMIPRELFALTWSCQHPVRNEDGTHTECRKCIGCARRIEGMVDSGEFEAIPDDVLQALNQDEYTQYVEKNDYKFHPPLIEFNGRLS